MKLNMGWNVLVYIPLILQFFLYSCKATDLSVCEGEVFKPSCPSGRFLVIDSANYGRTDPTACFNDGTTDERSCTSKSTVSSLNRYCFGKQECNVTVSDEFLDTSCEDGVSKYLRVQYHCIKDNEVAVMCSKYQIKLGDQPSGYIHSRNYPNRYTEDECVVKVNARHGFKYKFQLLDLDMQARRGTGCYDWLVVKDEANAAMTYNYCGQLHDIHTAEPDGAQNIKDLTVTFRADPMDHGRGFLLKYEEYAQEHDEL